MNERSQQNQTKRPQVQGENALSGSNPPPLLTGGKEVRCIRSAKKLLGKLISAFIRHEINSEESRTLCYLITSYVTICKDNDILQRIEQLEEKFKGRK